MDDDHREKKLETGKTVIGSKVGKIDGQLVSFTIYYGNYLMPRIGGRYLHLKQEEYSQMLDRFLESSKGSSYIRPTREEILEAMTEVLNAESSAEMQEEAEKAGEAGIGAKCPKENKAIEEATPETREVIHADEKPVANDTSNDTESTRVNVPDDDEVLLLASENASLKRRTAGMLAVIVIQAACIVALVLLRLLG